MSIRIHRAAFPATQGSMELRHSFRPHPKISHVVFDFDGTLSWLRHGWPGMLCDAFAEHAGEMDPDPILQEILALNGQPTIFQCRRLVELLPAGKGAGLTPEALLADFTTRLEAAIARRIEQVTDGTSPASAYLVHGARPFLEHLDSAGVTLAILSSTDQHRVVEEARLLGIAEFFGRHIYGGTGDPLGFSKRAIFDRLLAEEACPGANLLSFGDGPVELRETKELGGVAIAVCSDEFHNGSGLLDPHKRHALFAAGADAAIPDYRDASVLFDYLLGH